MGERAAIQRAAKALGYPPSVVRNLPKSVDELTDARLKGLVQSYIGVIQAYGCHASAVMLFPSDPAEWCAIEKQGNDYVCAYEYHDLEAMGLLKEDVLGIKTLDAIDDCCKMVKERTGVEPNIDNLPDSDEKTFAMLNKDDVLGCFQIESGGMRKIIQDIKPQNVFDLLPLVALYRPSTIQSGMVEEFTNRRKGMSFEYLHPRLANSLSETYGVMLYQEQAMKIVQDMAGYDLGQADVFRRAIGRKIPEVMAKLIPQFIKDCEAQGIEPKVAEQVAEWLSNAASYQFNKSHSAAYGYTCYQTAYLKAHYPLEYYCAYLNAYKDDKQEDLLPYIRDAKQHAIKIAPPSGQAPTCKWFIKNNILHMALNYISGIGEIDVPIKDIRRLPKNKVENLIKAGALDYIGDRQELLEDLYKSGQLMKLQNQYKTADERMKKNQSIYESAKDGTKKKNEAKEKMLKYSEQKWQLKAKIDEVNAINTDFNKSAMESEVLGMTFENVFSRYDLTKYKEPIGENDTANIVTIGVVRRIKHWKQRNGKPMMFFTLECPSGKQYDLVMFNYVYTELTLNKVYVMSIIGNKFKKII